RSGKSFLKASIFMEPSRSATSATTLGFCLPSSCSPTPKPERVSFLSVKVNFVIAVELKVTQCFFQLRHCLFKFLFVGGYAVPFVTAHHEVNAIAHYSSHKIEDRLSLFCKTLCFLD